jgi:hypothetical protein
MKPSDAVTLWVAVAATVALSIWFYKLANWRPRMHPILRTLIALVCAAAGAALVWGVAYAVETYIHPDATRNESTALIAIGAAVVLALVFEGVSVLGFHRHRTPKSS